jgi:hypothetical protein
VAALIGAAVAILGALTYLFVAVRAAPAVAGAPPPLVAAAPAPAPAPEPEAAEPEAAARAVAPTAAPARRSEPAPIATDLKTDPDLSLSQAMDEANRLFDRQEHDAAQEAALKILERSPGNVRMLRIVVTTACMMGETDKAQRHWDQLPERDREQMSTRCGRFGVTFRR